MIVLSVAKLKMFLPESKIFLWIKPKKKKKLLCGKFGSMPTFGSTRKGKKCFLWWASTCLTTRCYTTSHLHQLFFRFRRDFFAFFARISYFKCLEFKEFNKTIIPFALVGYETGYSQLGATRLVGYLPSQYPIMSYPRAWLIVTRRGEKIITKLTYLWYITNISLVNKDASFPPVP